MYSEKIYTFIKENDLIKDDDKVVVAVSGGPDSMCLLHYLINYKKLNNLKNFEIIAGHVNHNTRGIENIEEQNLISDFCVQNDIQLLIENFNYKSNNNFHDEARKFRYEFFSKICKKYSANKIVLAHHQDDQIETILFKIIRGNTINGYTGMKAIYDFNNQIKIIRPFLNLTKDEILDYCRFNKIPYKVDSSNLINKYTRNYLRNEIIPDIKKIQPDFNNKVIQLQKQLLEVNDYLEQNAKTIYDEIVIRELEDELILNLNPLRIIHNSLIRLIILNVFKNITNNNLELSYEKTNNIINIIKNDKPNIIFDCGKDYYCIKEYDHLIFKKGLEPSKVYCIEINEFNEYTLPNNLKISVKKVEEKAKTNNNSLILCYNSTMWPLVIRNRKEGDRIKTKIGTKKLNRIFIDQKIPTSQRDQWPILTDKNDNIIWVLGLAKKEMELETKNEYILIKVE